MLYRELPAKDIYKPYIQKFWILDNSASPLQTRFTYALPNGCCTMGFISGNGLSMTFADEAVEIPSGVFLSGQITKRVGISLKPYTKAIMAQVKPWLPAMITNVAMTELVDNAVSLELINQKVFQKFTPIDLSDEAAVVATLYQNLNTHSHQVEDIYFTQWMFGKLRNGVFTKFSVADIAAASGYTQRRVEQKFKTLIGPAPKVMQRILQLRQLIDDLSNPEAYNNLSALAARHGYYDQSHFIKSYQRILSETPVQFDTANYILPMAGHFDFLQS